MNQTAHDQVKFFTQPRLLRQPAFQILNAIQDETHGVQILSVATVLMSLSQGAGLDPHEVIEMIRRGDREIDGPFTKEIKAIKAYGRGEMSGDST